MKPGVCQLRLDFIHFKMGKMSSSGQCPEGDSLEVEMSVKNSQLPVKQLCGTLTSHQVVRKYFMQNISYKIISSYNCIHPRPQILISIFTLEKMTATRPGLSPSTPASPTSGTPGTSRSLRSPAMELLYKLLQDVLR